MGMPSTMASSGLLLARVGHLLRHGGPDQAGANGVDADAPRSVFQRRAFGQAENAMLGRMIGAALGTADQPADRRAVDDSAASLPTHLLQLVLHAGPDTTQVDRVHAIEILGRGV